MRIAIVEDEAVVARRLERMVREMVTGAKIEVCASWEAARNLVRGSELDVLLLDLRLGGQDGFRLLEEATAASFQTVVVSAHREQALRAFEYGVVDFVAKPWSAERLRIALDRALGRVAVGAERARRLAVRKGKQIQSVAVDRLVFLRAADDYSELHLEDGSVHLHEKALGALAAILPAEFERVHRSYVVHFDRVRCLVGGPGGKLRLVLVNGQEVPVGRLYRSAVRSRMGLDLG
ncbi:MAG: LytTR family DNA-binding domain-containing protein [Thermoanaerobaculia bacterium]|nr:LytTR family DNA-binding domain-containing protein [Thermoanaerobaculia bacterium]